MLAGQDIIIISAVPFEDHWTSKQEISRVLAMKNRVLYVSGIPRPYKHDELVRAKLGGSLREALPSLFVFTPPAARIPLDYTFKTFSNILQSITSRSVKRATTKLGFTKPIIWAFDFRARPYIGLFDEILSIYHCVDNWHLLLDKRHYRRITIKRLEQSIVESVDLVLTSAQDLKARIEESYAKEGHYVPHGVDFGLFSKGGIEGPLPEDMKRISKPIVGFVGSVGKWVDCKLILEVARTFPEVSVVLIGSILDVSDAVYLKKASNILMLGPKPKGQIPDYIRAFNICLMPFKINEFTRSINPLKYLEYLASGKPLVTTAIQELVSHAALVYLASNEKEFLYGINRALSENDPSLRRNRIDFARNHTWVCQVEKACSIIQRRINVENLDY